MSEEERNKKIRTRKSYKMYERFFALGAGKAVLEELHKELDSRRAYYSTRAADYSRESLDLFLKDHGA
jgi:hypothetical protein